MEQFQEQENPVRHAANARTLGQAQTAASAVEKRAAIRWMRCNFSHSPLSSALLLSGSDLREQLQVQRLKSSIIRRWIQECTIVASTSAGVGRAGENGGIGESTMEQ